MSRGCRLRYFAASEVTISDAVPYGNLGPGTPALDERLMLPIYGRETG